MAICEAFDDSSNVEISVYYDIGLSMISTGYVGSGEIDSDDFSGGLFDLYAWGQTDTLNVSLFPDDRYFTLSSLTIGEIYYISFNYKFNCPYVDSDFSFGLYEIVDKWVFYNSTGTSGFNSTFEQKWIIKGSDLNGDETGNGSYSFMASSSEQKFVLKVLLQYSVETMFVSGQSLHLFCVFSQLQSKKHKND